MFSSSKSSSTPLTVNVFAVLQLVELNTKVDGETVTLSGSKLLGVKVVETEGWVFNTIV